MAELNENEPLIRRDNQEERSDPDNRDPKKINEDVAKVDFEDVIAEPDGVHSADLVWKASNKIYTWSKYWYCGLSAIFALPLTLIWGLLFAFLTFWRIWAVVPSIKICVFVFDCLCRPLLLVIKEIVHPLTPHIKAAGKLGHWLRGIVRREA